MKKHFLFLLSLGCLFAGCAAPRMARGPAPIPAPPPSPPARRIVVVIDPGHGGQAKGAVGPNGLREKEVTLDIARRLKELLAGRGRAELTRDGDYDVSLTDRRSLAQKEKADIFISLHCDGNRNRRCNGTAVYVLSREGNSLVRERALTDGDFLQEASAAENGRNGYLERTVVDLVQESSERESRLLAKAAAAALSRELGTKNLGVKEANFAVLKSIDVPSVLVEIAFVTNWWEEKLLRDPAFRQRVAEALSRAVGSYLQFFGAP